MRGPLLLEPGDAPALALACLWGFCVLAAMYVIVPVRGAFLLTNYGAGVVPWVYIASAAATGAAVWAYNLFAGAGRARLVGGTLLLLAASSAGWWVAAQWVSTVGWIAFVFSLWADVASIMSVTVFWSYMNDVFRGERAKRWFGLIAASAALGSIAASFAVHRLVRVVGTYPLLLAAAALTAATLGLMAALERWAAGRPAAVPEPPRPPTGVWREIYASRLLRLLALLVVLERLVPDVANYLFYVQMRAAYPQQEALAAAFAAFAQWTNLAAFAAGVGISTWLLRAAGLEWSLASCAVPNLLGMGLYAVHPGLGVAVGFNAAEATFRYSVFKAGKETAYTAAPKEVLYRAKSVIEMFLYRLARGIAGFFLLVLSAPWLLALSPVAVAAAGVPLALLWVWVAWRLADEFRGATSAGRAAAGALSARAD